MAWLTRESQVLATLDSSAGQPCGARLVRGPALIHTLGSRGTLGGRGGVDVAWCRPSPDSGRWPPATLDVYRVAAVGAWRIARPCSPGAVAVVAGPAAFERWRLRVGDRLEVEGA